MVFNSYSKYYDLLYEDKNYPAEADYIDTLINRFSSGDSKSILELGCGTGKHAWLLAEKDYEIVGVDRSESMVTSAMALGNKRHSVANKPPHFQRGDIKNVSLDRTFDVVVSLFHVVSYLNTNADLLQTFKNAHKHLRPGGLFIFDVWYGPAVLSNRPDIRIKRLQGNGIEVIRLSEPELRSESNLVDVNYEVHVKDLQSGETEVIEEKHVMRYLFAPELEELLQRAGFKEVLRMEEWLSGRTPGLDTWGVVFVAKK